MIWAEENKLEPCIDLCLSEGFIMQLTAPRNPTFRGPSIRKKDEIYPSHSKYEDICSPLTPSFLARKEDD